MLTTVELFAGAGGMLLGLEAAGLTPLLASESHAHPCLTLRRNFPLLRVVEAPIQDLSARDMFGAAGYDRVPGVDLVAGGPPCQGFSNAGAKDPADPRNSLIGEFIRMVGEIQPRAFLLETVAGLRTLHGGRLWDNVAGELAGLGYEFRASELYAADFGVPQMRRRWMVLGSREGPAPDYPQPGALRVTVGEALGDLPLIGPGETCSEYGADPFTDYQKRMRAGAHCLLNHVATRHSQRTVEYFRLFPPGGNAGDIPAGQRTGKQGVQRWPLDGLARTVTTAPEDFIHPTLDRIPTIRELARVQGFPDRFEFMGQRTAGNRQRRLGYCSQSQQVGNAVPPPLAEAVGRGIARALG